LGELTVRWTGDIESELAVGDEFDEPAGQAAQDEDGGE
jgi:hypothetical protein